MCSVINSPVHLDRLFNGWSTLKCDDDLSSLYSRSLKLAQTLKNLTDAMSVPDDKVLEDFLSFSTKKVESPREAMRELELSMAMALRKIRRQA